MAQTKEHKRKFYKALCDLQVPDTIKFSPDAKYVVYSTALTWGHKKGKNFLSTLWLADTGKPGSSRQITVGTSKDFAPRWSPDGERIAFISDRAKADQKWAIYVVNVRSGVIEGEAYPVTPTENEQQISVFEFSPDGKTLAYLSPDEKALEQKAREDDGEDWEVWDEDWPYARLRTVDLTTKELKVHTSSAGSGLSNRHIRSFCWSPSGNEIAIISVRSPHIEEPFQTGVRISVLRGSQLTQVEDICSLPGVPQDFVWARDGGLYFIAGTPIDKTCAGSSVYKVPSKLGPSAQSASQPWEKIAFGVENDVAHIITIEGDVIASVQHGMSDRIYLVPGRILFSKPQEIVAFDARYTIDSDEIALAIATSDVNHPVEVFTTTASGGALVQLSNHGTAFKNQHFGTCKYLSCPSLDNEVQLDHILIIPGTESSAPPKTLPTAVLIHGGPDMRITNAFNTPYYFWAPYLLRLGYNVLLPNYRGSSGKGETFAFYSCRGQGKWDHEDVIAATQHAIEKGYIDKERIIIGGISQGGFLSYLASVRNGKHGFGWKFQASIPIAGFCDTDSMALTSDLGGTLEMELNDHRAPWKMLKEDTRSRQASALWEFREAMERSNETGEMVIPPMLILHGEKDERCPLVQAWGMRRALMSVDLPFEMVTYKRQPHLFTDQKHWVDMMERIEKWCEKYIGLGETQS